MLPKNELPASGEAPEIVPSVSNITSRRDLLRLRTQDTLVGNDPPWPESMNGEGRLDAMLQRNTSRVTRENTFRRTMEKHCSGGLQTLRAYVDEVGLQNFSAKELLEISNRFRLLGGAQDEICVFEDCGNEEFRAIPRAREFYAFALIKVKRSRDAVMTLHTIIREGGGNNLVFGTLGDAISDTALSAEKFAQSVADAGGVEQVNKEKAGFFEANFGYDPRPTGSMDDLMRRNDFRREFDMDPPTTPAGFRALAALCRKRSIVAYRQGFLESSGGFCGVGWLRRLAEEHAVLKEEMTSKRSPDETLSNQITSIEKSMRDLRPLVGVAVEKEGGASSLDFWLHASRLEIAIHDLAPDATIDAILADLRKTADAEFKPRNTFNRIRRFRDIMKREAYARRSLGESDERVQTRIGLANRALPILEALGEDLANGRREKVAEREPQTDEDFFLKKSFSFRGIVNAVVPWYIPGGIDRAGARVPDLMINRQDTALLRSCIARMKLVGDVQEWMSIEQDQLPQYVSTRMRDAIREIQGFVRTQFDVASLQDLHSKEHVRFDETSDGLIRLSGINPSRAVDKGRRRGTRSITNISAALLGGIGDCRETAYTVGSLFAVYQHMLIDRLTAEAIDLRSKGNNQAADHIANHLLPEILCYEVRAGHMGVYAGIEMKGMYDAERRSPEDQTAIRRRVLFDASGDASRSNATMSDYEFSEGIVMATLKGSSKLLIIEPRWEQVQTATGKKIWKVIKTPDGIPEIPGADPDWSNVQHVEVFPKVEEHTMTFLHIKGKEGQTGKVEFADGFYNEQFSERGDKPRFRSPYAFGAGTLDYSGAKKRNLLRAGSRVSVDQPGYTKTNAPVYLRFLGFSKTDYQRSLGEGDVPGNVRLLGNSITVPEDATEMMFERVRNKRRKPVAADQVMGRVRRWHMRKA